MLDGGYGWRQVLPETPSSIQTTTIGYRYLQAFARAKRGLAGEQFNAVSISVGRAASNCRSRIHFGLFHLCQT
jgi:hypothetical protein